MNKADANLVAEKTQDAQIKRTAKINPMPAEDSEGVAQFLECTISKSLLLLLSLPVLALTES